MKALTLFAIFLCVCYALEGPSDYLRDSDKAELKKLLSSSKSYLGLKNTYYTVATLQRLKESVPDKNKVCESSKEKVQDVSDVYYSVAIQDALGCVVAPSDKVTQELKKALSSETFNNLYFGISSALLLKKNKQLNGLDNEVKSAVQKLVKLGEEDGTFKSSPKSDDGSVLNGGLALQVLSQYVSDSLSADEKSQIETVLSNAQDIFTSFGEETDTTLHLVDSASKASNLRVTSTVFKGFTALAGALNDKSVKPDDDKVVAVTEYFIQHKRSVNVEDAYFVVEGLSASSYNTLSVPVVVSLTDSSISSSSKEGQVGVKLTNVLGDSVDGKLVLVKAYQSSSPSKSLLSNQEVKDNKLNFLAAKPEAGFYELEFKVSPSKSLYISSTSTRSLKVLTTVSLSDVNLVVSGSTVDAKDAKKFNVENNKAVSEVVSVEEFQHLFVNFQVKGSNGNNLQVQQAFVRFSNDHKEAVTFAKYTGKQYQLHVSGEELSELLEGESGKYTAQLIVGDSYVQNPQLIKLATVEAKFGNNSNRGTADPYAPKPEIIHQFRPAEKRPNAAVSFGFTLAVLSPFLVFAVGLLRIGLNFGNYPTSGLQPIYALGFHATFGLILALFAIYWINLTMVTTLKYLGVLAVPYFFFASKTLNHLAQASAAKAHRD